jgi:beta-glucosidase-like glycosyl hydrolase
MSGREHLSRMSLREKCAQRVFCDFRFDDPDYDRVMHLVKKVGVGGVCLFGGTVFDVAPLVNSLQRVSKLPLLVAADYENGPGEHVSGATRFPSNLALGAAGSAELAQAKGRLTAREAQALGVRWVLAPVVDVNANPRNPVIDTRSFGDDPAAVTALARAFLAGLREMKAMGCLKHFPGHGGVAVDSHLELPVLERDLEALRASDLRPFAELAGEAEAVMTGHLRVPAIDPDAPASLSARATEGLLRGELGFGGLVATDALRMGAVEKFCPEPEAVERSALAGADVILYPGDPERAVDVLERLVTEGKLGDQAVYRSVERILAAKQKHGLFGERISDQSRVEQVVGAPSHRAAAARMAEQAVTLVRGSGRVPEAVSLLAVKDEGERGDTGVFERELAARARIEEGAGTLVAAVFFRPRAYSGRAELDPASVAAVRERAARHRETIVVAFGTPTLLRQMPEGSAFVAAYGSDEASQRAAARALAGEIPFAGKLPLNLGV